MVDLDLFQRGPRGQRFRAAPDPSRCAECLGHVVLADRNTAEGVDDANRRKQGSRQILAADLGSSHLALPDAMPFFIVGKQN
jgi:hypothetical protein